MILGMLEGPDLIIVLVIVMVLFGARKLPELARGLGQAKREFEHAISGKDDPAPAAKDAAALDTPTAEAPTAGSTTPAVSRVVHVDSSDAVTLSREEYERLRRLDHPTTSDTGEA